MGLLLQKSVIYKAMTKNKGGLKKGQTNNRNGRPVGSKNKVSIATKERIAEFVENDFDAYVHELRQLKGYPRVKAMTELIKLIVPRPMSDEEKNGARAMQSVFDRILGSDKEKE
jgi:hypothetical protein